MTALTVTRAALTVIGSQAYNGTTSFNVANLTVSGVGNDTFVVAGTADLSSKNVQTNMPLLNVNGLSLLGNGGATLSNYLPLSISNTSVSITPLPITLTAPVINKVYDGGYTYNMTGADLSNMSAQLVGGDRVSIATVQFLTSAAGLGKEVDVLTASINDGNSGHNYNVSLAASFTSAISKAALVVTAASDAKFVAMVDASGFSGLMVRGFVNGETVANLSGTGVISRTNASVNNAGNYTGVLEPSGYTSSNYSISYVAGDYTIVPANQLLIRVTPTTITYGGSPTYAITAQYLMSDNTRVTLHPVNNGMITINDGANGITSFTLAALNPSFSNAGYLAVGAYNLTNVGTTITNNNFNSMVVVGSLTVSPMQLSVAQLGLTGVAKMYDGSASISGVLMNTNATTSSVLAGDTVALTGTGAFSDQNVGVNKAININVVLSGADALNYALSSTQIQSSASLPLYGTITQLPSVTWVGPNAGGNWSNAANWVGGAIPTANNVGQVLIPTSANVIYDSVLVGQIGSTIVNNGNITFSSASSFNLVNNVSGVGAITQSGAGTLTLSGNNTFTGNLNLNTASVILASANAAGSGSIVSNNGSLSVVNGITINNLKLSGNVNLLTDFNGTLNVVAGAVATIDVSQASQSTITLNGSIVDNGTLNFAGSKPIVLASVVSGSGTLNLTGSAPLTLSGNNTFTGNININASQLILGSVNAQGGALLNANGGSLYVTTGIVLPSLTVGGPVTLASDIVTTGAQTYNGAVTISAGNAVGGVITPMHLTTNNANITFNSTLVAQSTALANEQSLTLNAGTGWVTFGDRLGANLVSPVTNVELSYGTVWNNPTYMVNPYQLIVNAGTVLIKGNITTFGNQTYNGKVLIGDNGTNGLTRVLLSEDPIITFNGTVDDTIFNTHNLIVKSISISGNEIPEIHVNGDVGATTPLASFVQIVGTQNADPASVFADATHNPNAIISNRGVIYQPQPPKSGAKVDSFDRGAAFIANIINKESLRDLSAQSIEADVEVGKVTLMDLCEKPNAKECPLI
jgi:autotransporter-associated beta strand protein